MPFRQLPLAARIYIFANVVVGFGIVAGAISWQGFGFDLRFGLLLMAGLLASAFQVQLTVDHGRMSLGNTIVFLAIMMHCSAAQVICIAILNGLMATAILRPSHRGAQAGRKTWYRPALTTANLIQSSAGALWIWSRDIFPQDPIRGQFSTAALAGLLSMTTAYFLINTLGISLAVALSEGAKPLKVWRENFFWTFPGYLYAACASGGAAVLYGTMRAGSFLLLPPVYLVYASYKLYLDKINAELRHIQDLNELNERVISTLAMTIEAKDRYTHKHVERVREYALGIAKVLGVTGAELEAVRIGSMVHDIGKIAVPEMILAKPGKLTPEEFERMKTHVSVGVKILEAVNFPFSAADAVASHHERWDGNGYPNGLKGEEIPRVGRIVAIADGFDALTSDRHYRRRMSNAEAIELIRAQSGRHYDPQMVDALVRSLPVVKPIIDMLDQQEWNADQHAGRPRMVPQELVEEIARAAEEAVVLAEMSLKPNMSSSPQEVMDALLAKAMLLLPATSGAVFVLDEDKEELAVRASSGLYVNLLLGLTVKVGEGVSGWVVGHGLTALNAPAAGDLARRIEPGQNLELNSCLSVPLQAGKSCIGAITLYHTGYNLYSDHHQRLLNTLAEHASGALETLAKLEISQALAHTDSLTELPNTRFIIQYLEELTSPGSQPTTIVLLDLDRFKQINDSYGHMEGDRVLRDVAQMLSECTRGKDLACRYAGDEFVVVCQGSTANEANRIADRIRQALLYYRPIMGSEMDLSASIGVASYPEDGTDWRSLLAVADRRMYTDKLAHHAGEIPADGQQLRTAPVTTS